jgi:hypothetical protein
MKSVEQETIDEVPGVYDVRVTYAPRPRSRTPRARYASIRAQGIVAMLDFLADQPKPVIDRHALVLAGAHTVMLGREFDRLALTEMPDYPGSNKLDPLNHELVALLLLLAEEPISVRAAFVALLETAAKIYGMSICAHLRTWIASAALSWEARSAIERIAELVLLAHRVVIRRFGRRLSYSALEAPLFERLDARTLIDGGSLLEIVRAE